MVVMEKFMPLPDISSELRGRTPKQILLQYLEYLATEIYRFLPKADFLSDDYKLNLIKSVTKERDIIKNYETEFQKTVREYKMRNSAEKRKRARLRIPEIVKDNARIEEIFKLCETVQKTLKEQNFPLHLAMTVSRCMERVRNNLKTNKINITRGMVKALKLIKLGTENEKKHDATFLVCIGVQDLKEAVVKEFARANQR